MDPSVYIPAYLERAYVASHPELTDAARELVHNDISANPQKYAQSEHAQALLSLFVTAAVDGGASGDLVYKLSRQYLARLYRSKTVEEICFFLQEALENLMAEMLTGTDNGNPYIRAALSYMTKNYSKPLTLESVAAEVSLSPNYFSSLFRRTVGVTFREQLNRIRVEESKRLLLSTDYSLIDIAIAMGFNDQGYYCKVFKRVTGLTPGSYRAKQDRTLTAGA